MLNFTKMNGAGNDFVVFDNRDGKLELGAGAIRRICDRHRGVGADGVLLLETARGNGDSGGYGSDAPSFRMRYYNSDGGEAEMCGNGARCFARFASRAAGGMDKVSFETQAGHIGAELLGDSVRIAMGEPRDFREALNVNVDGESLTVHSVNTGVPHAVIFVDDVSRVDVEKRGSAVRHHALFAPKGTNVNFVEKLGPDEIAIRTFERGVEGETLACGTGVVACALIFCRVTGAKAPIRARVRGGETLLVGFRADGLGDVTLTGPADFVFDGNIDL